MFTTEEWRKIRELVVMVAGAGGLGTHQTVELQRIGVKKIYLFDPDRVEPSNLNRQILYGSGDLGEPKVERAEDMLEGFALGTEVVIRQERVTDETEVPSDVQLLFCALDNFESRFALGRLAQKYGLPLVHGGVEAWYGQVTTFIPGKTRTFEELVGEVFTQGLTKQAFSPVVSLVAALQVIEGLKVLLGRPDTLAGRLLVVDLRDYSLSLLTV